ncbi:Oxalate--CoA ligase [Vitis vinifera]|uniref:Oxalate--CoA ligase n=1 Tax=Vitis vinifera TaxID=29760 RepID=A0A438IYV0_VITVI|nr:Oxalate--CoA ligase [Vitis vinifera]
MMESLTLTGLLKQVAGEFPSRRALSVSGKFDLTYARLHQLVEGAASLILAGGVKAGDVVALTFPNTVEVSLYVLSCLVSQKILEFYLFRDYVFGCNTSTSHGCAFELSLHSRRVRVLLIRLGIEASLNIARRKRGSTSRGFQAQNHTRHGFPYRSEAEVNLSLIHSEPDPHSVAKLVNEPSDVALFLHTSGTTSRPKGVPLSQLNLASSVQNIKSVYKLTESDSTVIVLPLFHVHGLLAGLLSSLGAGAAVTLPAAGRFSASTFWSDMLKYDATCASLAPAIMARLEEAFGAPVLEAYAMTEATHLMASNPLPENGPHKPGSVGRPVGQEMAILDENGVQQEANVSGEVCIRGPNVTKGYKNNPEANKSAFQFGWFHTGISGSLTRMVICILLVESRNSSTVESLSIFSGEKISPIEVDAVLLSHPDIAQAVAFGVPDDKYGEEINCAIIPREGSDIDEAEVTRFCKKNLAAFKVPKKASSLILSQRRLLGRSSEELWLSTSLPKSLLLKSQSLGHRKKINQ